MNAKSQASVLKCSIIFNKDLCYSYLILNDILQCLMVAHEFLLIIKLVNLRTEDDLNVLKIYTLYIDAKLIMMFEKLNNLF